MNENDDIREGDRAARVSERGCNQYHDSDCFAVLSQSKASGRE